MKHTIYSLTCTATGKHYIGQTIDPATRHSSHLASLRANRHHSKELQADFFAYGESSIEFETLSVVTTQDDANRKEAYWSGYFDSINSGYNVRKFWHSFGPRTATARVKIALGHRGLKHSEETRRRMSESQRRRRQVEAQQ